MKIDRRELLAGIAAASFTTAGCVGATNVKDLAVLNETSTKVSVTMLARVQNGQSEELFWTPTLAGDETWTWNRLGDRILRRIEVRTDTGLETSRSWDADGIGGQGITTYIKEETIEILETTG